MGAEKVETVAGVAGEEAKKPTLLVIRDPDVNNEFVTDGEIRVYSLDLGYQMNGLPDIANMDRDEAIDLLANWLDMVAKLPKASAVRSGVEGFVEEAKGYIRAVPGSNGSQLPEVSDTEGSQLEVPAVLVVRNPDDYNQFMIDGDVEIIDIDLGASIDGLRDLANVPQVEALERIHGWEVEVEELGLAEDSPVRTRVGELVDVAKQYVIPTKEEREL